VSNRGLPLACFSFYLSAPEWSFSRKLAIVFFESAQLLPLALDNYNFLLEWFNQFPEYRSNPFYVTGESYA
jgi:hypothetical protein